MKTCASLHIILAIATVAFALGAVAQPKLESNSPARPSERLAAIAQRQGGSGIERIYGILTQEQRDSLRDANEGQREKTRELEQKIRAARLAILDLSVAEKFNEDAVRKKANELAKLDAELTVLRAKTFSQVKPPLSKEQIEKIKNPQPFGGPGNLRERFNERAKPIEPGRDENDLPPAPKPK